MLELAILAAGTMAAAGFIFLPLMQRTFKRWRRRR